MVIVFNFERKVSTIFIPHHLDVVNESMDRLFDGFVSALSKAEEVLVMQGYPEVKQMADVIRKERLLGRNVYKYSKLYYN